MLRPRGHWRYWTRQGRTAAISLRGAGGLPVRIVEESTGRLVGTVDEPSAHVLAHTGAVYPHQGEMYLVTRLDLADGVALVEARDPGYATSARELTSIEVAAELRRACWGTAQVHFGDVPGDPAGDLLCPPPSGHRPAGRRVAARWRLGWRHGQRERCRGT